MSLKDIFCQDRAIGGLQHAYDAGRLAHAYIFAGPEGVGKFKTACEWAKMLLCENKSEEKTSAGAFYDSCGQCESCKLFESAGHPDFKHIYKELVQYTKKGKGKTTPVFMPKDVIDEFLIEKIATRPTMGQSVVYIVSEAEKLNNSSQNALLKILEEPPAHCFIILLCTHMEKLLPTTQSRCQRVRFGPIDEDIIIQALIETGVNNTEAAYWARFSDGSIGTAIAWATLEPAEQSCYKIKKELIKRLAKLRLADCIDFADWMCKSARQISDTWSSSDKSASKSDITRRAQKGLLRMIITAFNDIVKAEITPGPGLVNSDQIPEINALAGHFDAQQAAEKVLKTYENIRWVNASVNEKLIFEELLLNLAGCDIIINSV